MFLILTISLASSRCLHSVPASNIRTQLYYLLGKVIRVNLNLSLLALWCHLFGVLGSKGLPVWVRGPHLLFAVASLAELASLAPSIQPLGTTSAHSSVFSTLPWALWFYSLGRGKLPGFQMLQWPLVCSVALARQLASSHLIFFLHTTWRKERSQL